MACDLQAPGVSLSGLSELSHSRRLEFLERRLTAQAVTPALSLAAGRFPAPPSLVFVFIRFGEGGGVEEGYGGNTAV